MSKRETPKGIVEDVSTSELDQIKQALATLQDQNKQLKDQISKLQTQIEVLRKFALDTREIAVVGNETLPALAYQYKSFLLKEEAFIRELQDLGKTSAQRLYDFEYAMREATRSKETANLYRESIDNAMKRIKSQQSQIAELQNELQKVKAELEAKNKYIEELQELPKLMLELAQRGELPSEHVMQLKEQFPDLFASSGE